MKKNDLNLIVRKIHDKFLDWFGPKCKEYCSNCVTCESWRFFEELKEDIKNLPIAKKVRQKNEKAKRQ